MSVEEQPTPPSLTLLPVGRAVIASSALSEGSSQGLVSEKNLSRIVLYYTQARRLKKLSLFGHLFFNITDFFCAKKRSRHDCICPRMGTAG